MPRPFELVIKRVSVEHRFHPLLETFARARRRIAKVELQLQRSWNDVGGACSGIHVRRLPARGRKILVAAVPVHRGQLGDGRCDKMDRILRQVRIGDVALHATDDERPGKRAAAAVFDHVAQSIDR